jgi:hypothetical protein
MRSPCVGEQIGSCFRSPGGNDIADDLMSITPNRTVWSADWAAIPSGF